MSNGQQTNMTFFEVIKAERSVKIQKGDFSAEIDSI